MWVTKTERGKVTYSDYRHQKDQVFKLLGLSCNYKLFNCMIHLKCIVFDFQSNYLKDNNENGKTFVNMKQLNQL